MKHFSLVIILFSILPLWAQVGINTNTPAATLDVQGSTIIDESLYLESPGNSYEIRGSKLLIKTTADEILEYDIAASKYGPINTALFVFRNTSTNGLQDYDTKISILDYIVTVQGYYFTAQGSTNVLLHSNLADENIEGYQIYAYPNPVTNTWFLRAFVNDSTFRSGAEFTDNPIDLFLNLVIYRQRFIAKTLTDINVNMNNSETGTAPLPDGF